MIYPTGHILDPYHISIYSNGKSYWAFDALGDWLILPKHTWEGIINPFSFLNPLPIGCGPFKWNHRIEGDYVELDRWEHYHRRLEGHVNGGVIPPDWSFPLGFLGGLIIALPLVASVIYLHRDRAKWLD